MDYFYFKEDVHTELKKDYVVKDSSFDFRPGWVDSPVEWAKRYELESGLKVFVSEVQRDNLETSCALSKALVLKKVAEFKEVKSEYNFKGESTNAPSQTIQREAYVLKESVKTELKKVEVIQEYWEKRLTDSGEILFSCAHLVSYKE